MAGENKSPLDSFLKPQMTGQEAAAALPEPVQPSIAQRVNDASTRIMNNLTGKGLVPTQEGEIARLQRINNEQAQAQKAVTADEAGGITSTNMLTSDNPIESGASTLVNYGNAVVDSVNKLAGQTDKSFKTLGTLLDQATIPNNAQDAYNRIQQGKGTDADAALLNQKGNWWTQQVNVGENGLPTIGDETLGQRLDSISKNRATQNKSSFDDLPKTANSVQMDKAAADIQKSIEGKTGLDKFLSGAGAVLDNPGAAGQTMAESLPYMVGGLPGMAASSAVTGGAVLSQYLDTMSQKSGGQLPTAGDVAVGTALGTADAALNFAENVLNRAAMIPGAKTLSAGVAQRIAGAAQRLAPTSATAAASLARVVAPTVDLAKNSLTEGVVSSLQNQIEENYAKGKNEWDSKGNDLAFFQGLGAAAGFNAPGTVGGTVAEVGKTAASALQSRAESRDEIANAARNATPEDLVNPESADYNPAAAIRRAGLEVSRQNEDTTPEQMDAIHQTAQGAMDQAQNAHQSNLDAIAERKTAERSLADASQYVDAINNRLAEVAQDPNADPQVVSQLNDYLNNFQTQAQEAQAKIDSLPSTEELDASASQTATQLDAAKNEFKRYSTATGFNTSDTSTNKTAHDTLTNASASPEEMSSAADHVISHPMAYSSEDLQNMVRTAASNIPEAQLGSLRALADAKTAENAVKTGSKVQSEIFKSTSNNLSLNDYQSGIAKAVADNNKPRIDSLMTNIANFETSHAQKADLAQQYFNMAKNTGKAYQLLRTNNGWELNSGNKLSNADLRKNGGLTIHKGSNSLVGNIVNEAKAITSTRQYMEGIAQQQAPQTTTPVDVDTLLTQPATDTTATVTSPEPAKGEVTEAGVAEAQKPAKRLSTKDVRAMSNEEIEQNLDVTQAAMEASDDPNLEANFSALDKEYTRRADLAVNQNRGVDAPHRNLDAGFKPRNQEVQAQRSEAEASSQTVNTNQETDNEAQTTESAQTAPVTTDDLITNTDTLTPVQENTVAEGALPVFKVGQSLKDAVKAELAKAKPLQNLVLTGFNQRIRPGFGSPLVAVSNFIDTLKTAVSTGKFTEVNRFLKNHITETSEYGAKQKTLLKSFTDFHDKITANLDNVIKAKQDAYRYQDFAQFILDENGHFDSNTKTAIAAGVYSWLGENGDKMYLNSSEVAKTLGIPETAVTPAAMQRMADIGYRQDLITSQLGQRIYQAMGLAKRGDIDPTRASKLQNALGSYALHSMYANGLMEQSVITASENFNLQTMGMTENQLTQAYQTFQRDFGVSPGEAKHTVIFSRPARQYVDGKPQAINEIADIKTAMQGTQSLMSKLFSYDPAVREVLTTKPTGLKQKVFGRMNREVPSVLKERISKAMQYDYQIDQNVTNAMRNLQALDADALGHIFGQRSDADVPNEMAINKKGRDAKNADIQRSLDMGLEFAGRTGTNPFWMPMEVWTNQRIGDLATEFNPQGSKVHRAMGGLSAHNVDIAVQANAPVLDAQGKPTQYGMFLVSLAQGMEEAPVVGTDGKKLKTVDKQTYATFLPAFQNYLRTPETIRAVRAMQKLADNKASKADVGVIKDAVAAWGMNGQSFAALHNLAQYATALQQGKPSVKMMVQMESDGVTNGPILTNILNGSADYDLLKRGGLYREGDGITNMPTYRENGGQDYYELLGDAMKRHWNDQQANMQSQLKPIADALNYFGKGYGARAGAKTLATPFNYSAGIDALKAAMGRATLENVYGKITDLIPLARSADKAAFNQAHAEVSNNLAKLINGNPALPRTVDGLINYALKPAQEREIMSKDIDIRGQATETAVNEVAADFIASRDANTSMVNTTFALANVRYEAAKAELLTKRMAAGEIPVNAKGQPLEGLSQPDLDMLSNMIPNLPSATGVLSDNAKASGYPMAKVEKKFTAKSAATEIEVYFAQAANPRPAMDANGMMTTERTNQYKSVSSTVTETGLTNPGVAMGANVTQGTDAAISSDVISKIESQNVHDANILSPDSMIAGAKIQNKAMFDAVVSYHPQSLTANTMMAEIAEMQKATLTKEQRATAAKALQGMIKKIKPDFKGNMQSALNTIVADAYDRDINKLSVLSEIYAVNQYGTEGGEYFITDGDRKKINDEMSKLSKQKTQAIQRISQIMGSRTAPKAEPAAFTNPLSKFLSEASASTGTVALNDVLAKTKGRFSNPAYNEIHSLLSDLIPEGAVVNVLDGQTYPDNVKGQTLPQNKGAIAWSYQDKNTAQINVAANTVTPEVLMHEALHLALGRSSLSNKPAVKDVLARTEKLLGRIQTLVSADSQLTQQFAPALANVDEFISWGMTNPEFQRYLDSVSGIPEIGGRNRSWLGSAFTQFIDHMSGIIAGLTGRKVNARVTTAMEALAFDTAHLAKVLGSDMQSPKSSLSHPMSNTNNAADVVAKYSHTEIFDSLASTGGKQNSAEFLGTLRSNVNAIADQLYGKLGSRLTQNTNENYTPGQVWNDAVANGKAPFTTDALANGFTLTNQEAFAIESIEAAVSETLANGFGTPVNREIRRTWQEAKKNIKPSDLHNGNWNTATQAEKDLAQQKWDYLFNVTSDSGEAKHLSQFIAMAVAHEDTSKLLGFTMDNADVDSSGSAFEAATAYANHAINYASNMMSNTRDYQTAGTRAEALARKLVDIESNNRDKLMNGLNWANDKLEGVGDTVTAWGKLAVDKTISKTGLDRTGVNAVDAMAKVTGMASRDQLGSLKETLRQFRNYNNPNMADGSLASIATDAMNADEVRAYHESLLRNTKRIEQDRATLASVTESNLNEMFTTEMTTEDRSSITYTLLRNDLQSVLNMEGMNLDNLHKLVSDNKFRNQKIKQLENQISQVDHGNDKIIRAKALGYWLATRRNTLGRDLVLNAQAIATGAATHYTTVGIEPDPAHVSDIDALASMYALSYTKAEDRVRTAAVMEKELASGKDNGIKMLMATHANLLEDSANTLFTGNQLSRIKGYIPEDTNPHHDLRAVESGSVEERELVNMGYKLVAPLSQDPLSTHNQRVLYVSKENGYQRTVSGTFNLTGAQRKGSQVSVDPDASSRVRADELNTLREATYADVRSRESLSHTEFNPAAGKQTYAVPVLSTDGHIMDYRYMASHKTIDTFLDRNNDFANLLGRFAGQNIDKSEAPAHNAQILDALAEDAKEGLLKDPNAYFEIGPDAPTERGREIWAMMPYDARAHAQTLNGGNGMYVRNDLVNLTFGFRKFSLGTVFDADPAQRNLVSNLFATTLEAMFGDKAKAYTIKGERGVQELMQTIKDVIVIRNIKTQMNNMVANTALLGAYGVSPVNIVKDTKQALVAGLDYRKNYALMLKYQQQQRAGIGSHAENESRINELQDRLNGNPLAGFIAEGMMPTIVEDVQPDDRGYTYGSKIRQAFNNVTKPLPASVVTAARWAVIDKGTPVHKFLGDTAQFSDFAAKYVLYSHMTKHAKTKLSHTEALQRASDAFVNYDVPATATRQYLDDVGITMFTKYRVRIQRAMFYLLNKRPAAVLAHAAIVGQFTNAPDALDPLFIRNVGNPFSASVLQAPGISNIPMPWNLFRMAN